MKVCIQKICKLPHALCNNLRWEIEKIQTNDTITKATGGWSFGLTGTKAGGGVENGTGPSNWISIEGIGIPVTLNDVGAIGHIEAWGTRAGLATFHPLDIYIYPCFALWCTNWNK